MKSGTSNSRKEWFAVGDYKKFPNEVGGMNTALPEEVAERMKELLTEYNAKEEKIFEDILKEWDSEKRYLTDTCLTAQDRYKAYLDYFRMEY